jgi:hypothetical protein
MIALREGVARESAAQPIDLDGFSSGWARASSVLTWRISHAGGKRALRGSLRGTSHGIWRLDRAQSLQSNHASGLVLGGFGFAGRRDEPLIFCVSHQQPR